MFTYLKAYMHILVTRSNVSFWGTTEKKEERNGFLHYFQRLGHMATR